MLGSGISGSLIGWWGNSLSSSNSSFGGGIGGGISNSLSGGVGSSGVFIEEASALFLWHMDIQILYLLIFCSIN